MNPDEISTDTRIDPDSEGEIQEEKDDQAEDQELDPIEQLAIKSEIERGIVPNDAEDVSENSVEDTEDDNQEADDDEEIVELIAAKAVVKIDGEEKEITQDALISSYQIQASARKKMTEAAELKKELERQIEEVKELKTSFESQDKTEIDDESLVPEFDLDDVVASIREGTDEEAVTAMAKLIDGLKQQVPNTEPVDVDSAVAQALERRREEEVQEARKLEEEAMADAELVFNDAFSDDLKADKRFFGLASAEDQVLVDDPEWSGKPIADRFKEAGKRARKLLRAEQQMRSTHRRQKKKEAQIPRQSGSRVTLKDKKSETLTHTDIVREMQLERGQVL